MPPDVLRAQFLDALTGSAVALDPEWVSAFRDVPREAFVPCFFIQRPGEPGWLLLEQPDPEWLAGVHSSAALITQIDGDNDNAARAREGRVEGTATSSSSAPTLMASMLQALHVRAGHKVLEIGTGTGYNAALLCHRLGSDHVTSMDIDHRLVDDAQERLAPLGYTPHLRAGDGSRGCAARGPFDRILGTVALARVPAAWIDQTAPGGRILMPLDLAGRGGLMALLDVDEHGKAEGRFLPQYGGFMSLRANQHRANDVLSAANTAVGEARTTTLGADAATSAPFEFMAALMVGGYDWVGFTPTEGGPAETWLTQPDGSWACHVTDAASAHTVRQGGPTRIWDNIEAARAQWERLRRPARQRFGITVDHEHHTVWLDHPNRGHRWTLPALAR